MLGSSDSTKNSHAAFSAAPTCSRLAVRITLLTVDAESDSLPEYIRSTIASTARPSVLSSPNLSSVPFWEDSARPEVSRALM